MQTFSPIECDKRGRAGSISSLSRIALQNHPGRNREHCPLENTFESENVATYGEPHMTQQVTKELADKSGVSESDVAKVLDVLGISKHYAEALQLSGKQSLSLSDMMILYRVGANVIVR